MNIILSILELMVLSFSAYFTILQKISGALLKTREYSSE
jgi:hypothetical protein